MKRESKSSLPRWRVIRIGGAKAREIWTLQAADAAAAVKRTIKEFPITDPAEQSRLAAHRVA
jgi:hypothetical protein